MAGETDQIKGRAKQAAGDLTNDEQLKTEGKADEASGGLKDKVDDAVDSVRDSAEKVAGKVKAKAEEMRN